MKNLFLTTAVLAALTVGASAFAGQTAQLGSGKSIEILAAGPAQIGKSQVLMFTYRTATSMDDEAALADEANEVWDRLAVDLAHAPFSSAVISAQSAPEGTGMVTHNKTFNTPFEKRDGDWRQVDPTPAKLDQAYVTAFLKRVDALYQRDEINALLVYLDKTWTSTDSDPSGKSPPQTLSREKFASLTYSTLKATKDFKLTRNITSIDISPDGLKATIKSAETEEGSINGQSHKITEDATDVIERKGDYTVLTKSDSADHVQ